MSDPGRPAGWRPPAADGHPGRLPDPRLPAPSAPSAPSARPLAPPPGYQSLIQAARSSTPWWRRWWVLLVVGLLVTAGVVAVAGDRSDDTADETAVDTGVAAPGEEPIEEPGEEAIEGAVATDADDGQSDVPRVGDRDLPYAIGEPAVITLDTFGDADGSVWTLTVDGPGRDITRAVLDTNQFNDPPSDGHVFYGVPITLTLDSAITQPLSTAFAIDPEFLLGRALTLVGDDLDDRCGVTPDPFDGYKEVFAGGSISGVVCYAVPEPEAGGGILLTVDSTARGRVFLATDDGVGEASLDELPTFAPPPIGGPAGSRGNPIPVGEAVTVTLDSIFDGDGSVWTLRVDGSGADITRAVLDANQFNDPPPDGHVFYGVPISFTLDRADEEPLSPLINARFEFYAPVRLEIVSDGASEGCGVVTDAFDSFAEVFVGGTVRGVVCYTVSIDDVAAGVMLTLDEIEQGRLFFATRP